MARAFGANRYVLWVAVLSGIVVGLLLSCGGGASMLIYAIISSYQAELNGDAPPNQSVIVAGALALCVIGVLVLAVVVVMGRQILAIGRLRAAHTPETLLGVLRAHRATWASMAIVVWFVVVLGLVGRVVAWLPG